MSATIERTALTRFQAVARRASDFPGAQQVPLEYPGRRPSGSYIYLDGLVLPLVAASRGRALLVGDEREMLTIEDFLQAERSPLLPERYAVLAVGSNACPGRLEEKFAGRNGDPIVVVKGWIDGVDSIYTSWLADYAALPATIADSPGTSVELWATLLTAGQFELMNRSERLGEDYRLVAVAAPLRLGSYEINGLYAYFDMRALVLRGEQIRVAAFEARGARRRALDQRAVLAAVLDNLQIHPQEPIEERHRLLRSDHGLMAAVNAYLAGSQAAGNSLGQSLAVVQPRGLSPLRWSGRA